MNTTLIVVACIWLVSFVILRGLTFAFFQREFPLISEANYRQDKFLTFFLCALVGPVNFILLPIALGKFWKHGWLWPGERAKDDATKRQQVAKQKITDEVINSYLGAPK